MLALLLALLAATGSTEAHPWRAADRVSGDRGGLGERLARAGLSFDASWTLETSYVFDGGVDEGSDFHHLLDGNVTFDLEPLLGLGGATLYLDAYALWGGPLWEDVGDFQAFSNIDAEPLDQIAELWWEQRLFDGALRWKIGKVDANTEFGYVEEGADFLHSGLSWPMTSGMPLYPDPATSVNVFVAPFESWTFALGCYDGAGQEGLHTGGRGAKTFLGSPADLFWIGQLDWRYGLAGGELPGRLALGATHHTGTFERFDGGTEEGTRSFYATLDQKLWREHPDIADDLTGLGVAAIVGLADKEVSNAVEQWSVGLEWSGFIPERDADTIGLAASYVEFSDAGLGDDYELAIELLFKVELTPSIVLRPDVQYVINPSGDPSIDNALVGLLRIDIAL